MRGALIAMVLVFALTSIPAIAQDDEQPERSKPEPRERREQRAERKLDQQRAREQGQVRGQLRQELRTRLRERLMDRRNAYRPLLRDRPGLAQRDFMARPGRRGAQVCPECGRPLPPSARSQRQTLGFGPPSGMAPGWQRRLDGFGPGRGFGGGFGNFGGYRGGRFGDRMPQDSINQTLPRQRDPFAGERPKRDNERPDQDRLRDRRQRDGERTEIPRDRDNPDRRPDRDLEDQ